MMGNVRLGGVAYATVRPLGRSHGVREHRQRKTC